MSLLETRIVEWVSDMDGKLDRDEKRDPVFGLLQSGIEQTASTESILSDSVKQMADDSMATPLEIPVYVRDELTVGTARTCAINDYENTTAKQLVVWNTYTYDISMVGAQYINQRTSYLKDLALKVKKVGRAFAQQAEADIFAALELAKSPVYNSALVGVGADYPLVGDALQVSEAQQDNFWNDLTSIMRDDDFDPIYKVIGTNPLASRVRRDVNQGNANAENKSFQFPDYDFNFTYGITETAGARSSGYCMPDGSIGLMTRLTPDERAGSQSSDGFKWGTYSALPFFPFTVGLKEKSTCGDNTSIQSGEHLKASLKENWQFAVDFAIVLPFNSDPATLAGGIKKFDFLRV